MKGGIAALALLSASPALAQGHACAAPQALPQLRPDLPSAGQPRRIVPIGGYTLAISWSPEFCRGHAGDAASAFQCGGGNRFGFVLHGLWSDGEGKEWPQYCRTTGLLPDPVVRGTLCATPSAQLLQHEWAKHGTCMADADAASYFGRSNALYARLRYPAMDALSRRPLTAAALATAISRANPGLRPTGMRITTRPGGWLDEVWICLDRGSAIAPVRRTRAASPRGRGCGSGEGNARGAPYLGAFRPCFGCASVRTLADCSPSDPAAFSSSSASELLAVLSASME